MKQMFIVLILIIVFTFPVSAFDESKLLGDISEYIPDEVSEHITDTESFDVNFIVKFLLELVALFINPVLKNFALLLGIIVIISAFAQIKTSLASESIAVVFDYVGLLCIALAAYNMIFELWQSVRNVLDGVTVVINSMIPVMASLYAAGGNAATAVANNASMTLVMTIMENICYYGLYPILQICFGISLAASVSNTINLSGISGFIRNTYIFILSLVMTILSAVMAYQTNLTLSADNVAARTVKFTMGNAIPIVGGAVGEAVRALSGSVVYIKNTVGIFAVFAIIIIILPVLVNLLLNRIGINLVSVIAKIIGCDKESAFLGDVVSLMNYAIAMLTACSVFFIFILTLFIKSAVAYGG